MTDINETAPRPGKTIYGASLGILSLDTKFPRIHGDIGNAETWPFPVLYKIVEGASPDMVVRKGARGLKEYFMQAAKDLVSMGADGIGTTCGFYRCSKMISLKRRVSPSQVHRLCKYHGFKVHCRQENELG